MALSPPYALKVGGDTEFSAAYDRRLGEVCPFVPHEVRVRAKVYVPNGKARVSLVVEVKRARPDAGKNLWQGMSIQQVLKRHGKWETVWKRVRLPTNLQPADQLLVYFWRTEGNSAPVYVDDLVVEAYR